MCDRDPVSVWEDEKVPETDGGGAGTTVWEHFMLLHCMLKNG